MPDYEIKHSTAVDRATIPTRLAAGHLGSTSDEYEAFIGSADTLFGLPVTSPQAPKSGLDVRRLFGVASQGQQDTYTDVDSVVQDASGIKLSPKPHLSPGTDVVTTGYIMPYELADGGGITIEAVGTFKCGSILPRFLAKLKIGGLYVTPQYEVYDPANATPSLPVDVAGTVANAFEWSSLTCGLNALGGYEALNVAAANLTQGEFQWRLTLRVHALGRWAKWPTGNDVAPAWSVASVSYVAGRTVSNGGSIWECIATHVSAAGTEPGVGASWATVWRALPARNCWVEATLEWGALQANGGARMGEAFGYYNPTASRNVQYQASLPAGTVRGTVYSFMGQRWLCHAASATTALLTAATVPAWADATAYVYGDIVENTGVAFYRCIVGHTSDLGGGLNEPGAGTDTTAYWELLSTDATAYNDKVWTQMLAEEAPGMGIHWREFFVPLVSKATISGFATVDWTAGNEIQLELGGPQQVDLGTSFAAYTTTVYLAEGAGITPAVPDGTVWAPKTTFYVTTFPHFVAGVSDVTGVTPSFTEAPDAATALRDRLWRQLPTTLRDEMRMQHVHGYLYGRRNGVAERRV
jgi:hypothetical protein